MKMKIARLSSLVILPISLAGFAHAQCDQPVLYSVSLSPNVISGDESEFTTGTISLCIPPSAALGNTISIEESISSYTYDSSGRLTEVQYSDGSQFNFQYNDPNSNTLISLVTDS